MTSSQSEHIPINSSSILTTLGCLAVIGMIIFWNLPVSALQNAINSKTQYVMKPLGLWQYWGMFHSLSTYAYAARIAEVRVDGQVDYVPVLHQYIGYNQVPDYEMIGNMIYDQNEYFINPMLRYYCKNNKQPGGLKQVNFEVSAIKIPSLNGGINQVNPFTQTPTYIPDKTVLCK